MVSLEQLRYFAREPEAMIGQPEDLIVTLVGPNADMARRAGYIECLNYATFRKAWQQHVEVAVGVLTLRPRVAANVRNG